MKTTLVTFEQFSDLGFKDPTTYYIRLATGDYLYIPLTTVKKVVGMLRKNMGSKYAIRTSKMIKSKPHYDGFTVTADEVTMGHYDEFITLEQENIELRERVRFLESELQAAKTLIEILINEEMKGKVNE